jgi:LPXTG-motif cell wall-anchored protein
VNIVIGPLHGSVTVNGNGTIDYTADAAYAGADSFGYQICDNDGACTSATVNITVTSLAGNSPPTAVNDFDTTDEDTAVRITVRNNDSDPDGDSLSIGSFTQSIHGTVRLAGGALRYTPDSNWNGTDSFTYEVCDPDGACDTATVTVVVAPVNDAPVAYDDAVGAKPGKPVDIPVTFNDDEPDGDAIVVTVMDQPAHGSVTVQPDGTIVYKSAGSYSGADAFTYEICDPDGDCSTATVSVVVQGGGTPPQNEPNDPLPGDPGDDPAPQGGTLPHTGIELLQLMLWGATLLAGGLVLVSRRVHLR